MLSTYAAADSEQANAIRQAVEQSLAARNRYAEQVVNALTDDLASTREQVGKALLRYKSLGSLPDNKLAGLKGLERLDAEIKSIMSEMKRTHTVRFRAEAKAAFRLGIYHGIEEFATAQLPFYRELTSDGLDKLATKAFQIVDTDALDFLVNYTTTLAGDVQRETSDGIMRVIRAAIATGKGTDDIVRDLGEVVKDKESFRHAGSKVFSNAQYRMEVIARTEVLRAHNQGKLKFHQAVGIQRLEWLTMDDERMCRVCGALDGHAFSIDQFPQQPAHPNCRCTHVPAWPLVICGGLLGATAAAGGQDACILPPQQIDALAQAQQQEAKQLKTAFESGDAAQLGTLTLKQVQTLAKQHGVSIARTKADFLKLLKAAEPGIDHSGLAGKALEAKLKQYGIGALRSKDELVTLLTEKQAAFIQAQQLAAAIKNAPLSGGLHDLSLAQLKDLAQQQGISLNMTKADVIALLDQLEPVVNHSGLSGQALIAAKKQFHIGPLKNKSQLISALEKSAGQQLGDVAKQAAIDAEKQSTLKAAQQALDTATGKVVLPSSPHGYTDFLAAVHQAETTLAQSSGLPQVALDKAAQEIALKKSVFQQQLSAMSANDLKTLAKESKVTHWQWATKNDLVTLMSETDPTKIQAAKDAIEAKWQLWKLQQAAGGSVAKKAADKAAQEAAAQAAEAAQQHAVETITAAVNAVPDTIAPAQYEDFLQALSHASTTFASQSSHLTPEQIAKVQAKLAQQKTVFQQQLSGMKVTELKAIAKAKKLKNWAFATKDDLITLMSETDSAKVESVAQALASKVAGYGHGASTMHSGQALAAQLAPDAPTPGITGGQYTGIDVAWSQVAAHPERHFTYARDAKDLGGVHPKAIYRDPDGNEWLFKPMDKASDAFLADADEMTYRVARLVDPHAVEVRRVTLHGQLGTIQRMQSGVQARKNYDGVDVDAIPAEEMAQLLQHQVLDWLLSNHDTHSANFLRLTDGTVIAIDRAQAFKYFGRDKLAITYNPNNLPEHPTTLYNAIFAKVKAKQLAVDPRHTLAAIERIEAIDDQEYLNLLRVYARGRPDDTEAFLQAALARKQSLRADFEAFYHSVLGDKQFSFANLLPAPKAAILPKHLEEAMSEVVERESWQGITIPFDTDMVEDVQLHLCAEQVPGTRGKGDLRTVYRLKMRPEKQQRILNIIAQVQQGKLSAAEVGSPLAEDAFYARILDGVRTVNGHLEHGSTRYNATKLSQALACEPELRALLHSDRIELRDMAEYYLQAIDELTIYQRGGVTPSGRVSTLEMFRVRPGRISEMGKAGGPRFKVAEGPVRLDQRSITNGRIRLQAKEKRPGQLFGGERSQKLPKTGIQYTLEFDDGTVIRVRPFPTGNYSEHAIVPGENYYAISGDIEVIAPGKGTPEQVAQTFEKLRTLGIPADVAPPEYQEYLYLHQVAVANNLQADDAGYRQLLQRLESRDAPITERVEALVQYWNTRLKVKDVRKLPRYNPVGEYQFDTQQGGKPQPIGYRRVSRFDLDVEKEMRGYNLMHQVVGGSASEYVKMVDLALTHNGSLLSTTEKLRIGVKPGGMSPEADMGSGGANYVFTRWRPDPRGSKSFREMGFYLKPSVAQRTDTIVYATDHYGRCYGDFVTEHRETSPARWKRIAETNRNNETILKQNVTLLDNLDCIVLDSASAKRQMIAMFGQHGIRQLPDGRKIDEIIHVISGAKKGYCG